MKPSELRTQTTAPKAVEEKLPYPRSDLAEPVITVHEARAATEAICRYHKGLICQTGDKDGSVFLCPIGRQYWRYTKQTGGFFAPLNYPRGGFV
jgi:hypothetical protein